MSHLEDDFEYILKKNNISGFVKEHKEKQPNYDLFYELNIYKTGRARTWKYDFVFPEKKVIVEIHGDIFHGRHTRGVGFLKDRTKMNYMAMKGWVVLEITTQHLQDYGYMKDVVDYLGG